MVRGKNRKDACGIGESRTSLRPQKCGLQSTDRTSVSHPLGWSPHAKEAMLQPLLQDILHTLPALTQAATPGDPAEAMPASVHCGKTKVFMTDSTVIWFGMRSGDHRSQLCALSRTGSGPSSGQGEERLR